MQGDEYNYQSDEQFTDKAWGNMQALLDKEMPVPKRKRRGFFWFFLFLGIGLVGTVWTFFPKQITTPIAKESQLNTTKESGKSPLLQNQKNSTDENNLTIEKKNNANAALIGNEKKAVEKLEKEEEKNIENKKGREQSPILATISDPKISKKQYTSKSDWLEKNENNLSSFSNNLALKKSNDDFYNNTITSSVDVQKTFDLATISPYFFTLKLKEEESKLIDIDFSKSEEKPVVESLEPPKRKTEFGIYAGALLDFSNTEIGGFGGGAVHFPLGEKMGLQTGIGYAMLPKKLDYNFSSSQEAIVEQGGAISIPGPERAIVESQTKFVLANLHYLEVPLLLTYAPIQKIQFQLGVSGSFLLKDQLDVTSDEIRLDEDATSNLGYELADLNTESFSTQPFQEEFFWNRWDVSAVAGIVWKPTSKWSVGVQYHHGWVNFFETNEEGIKQGQFKNIGDYSVANDPVVSLQSSSSFTRDSNLFKSKNYNRSIRLSIGYKF